MTGRLYKPSPRGEGCDTRIPPSKKGGEAALVNLSAPLLRHPERSRGIFIALPPYAHMRPHSNDTLVLPFSPFPHPQFTALQEGSLYFGPHDTQERRIVLYRFSYRCVELCLFEALHPAPSARAVWPHRKAPSCEAKLGSPSAGLPSPRAYSYRCYDW